MVLQSSVFFLWDLATANNFGHEFKQRELLTIPREDMENGE